MVRRLCETLKDALVQSCFFFLTENALLSLSNILWGALSSTIIINNTNNNVSYDDNDNDDDDDVNDNKTIRSMTTKTKTTNHQQ